MGCRIFTSEDVRRVFEENMQFLELEKGSGIYELYVDGRMSIGVSYEDIEKFEGEWLKDVYVFNLFVDGEYVNIEGEYVRDLDGNLMGADGLGGNGFEVVADAWNERVLEMGVFSLRDALRSVEALLKEGFSVRDDLGFEHGGQWIQNPFLDETMRFPVNPLDYYGAEKVRFFVGRLLLEFIQDVKQRSVDETLAEAALRSGDKSAPVGKEFDLEKE